MAQQIEIGPRRDQHLQDQDWRYPSASPWEKKGYSEVGVHKK